MSQMSGSGAARLKKPSWKDPRLIVGMLMVLASVAGVVALVGSADQTIEVYAAREPITVGQTISRDDLITVKVRLDDVESSYVTAQNGLPGGKVAVQRVGKNQLLPQESLGDRDALDRKPAAISVDEALPAQVVAGSRVDVWVAVPDARNGYAEPQMILPGAEIAEIIPGSSTLGATKSTVLMVLVADAQMPRLLGAQANKAKVSVVWNPAGATR